MNREIKFSAKIKPEFITELRAKVKEYFDTHNISKYGNARLHVKAAFMLMLYLLPFVLMLSGVITSVVAILICWSIMGVGMAGIGMGLMHDANHGSFSKNRAVNTLLGNSLYLLGGFPANWKFQHNTLHHGYTNIDGHDEDIEPLGILRFSPHKPLAKMHKFQHWYAWFFYGLLTLSWITIKDFGQLIKYRKMGDEISNTRTFNRLFIKLILSKIAYYFIFLILPLLLISISWYWIVLSFVLMHFICGLILAIIFQTAHVVPTSEYPLPDENGNIENNWAIHQLQTTSDFAPKSIFLSWFIGGLNYQVEHHLFPNISHVHYRKLSILVKETATKYGLTYHVQPTFVSAVYSHARMLKILGSK